MINLVRQADIHGVNFQLTFNGQTSYKSAYSGFLSIAFFTIVAIISYYNFSKVWKGKVDTATGFVTQTFGDSKLNSNNFQFGIAFKQDSTPILSDTYTNYEAKQIKMPEKTEYNLAVDKCDIDGFPHVSCVQFNNIEVGGEPLTNNFKKVTLEYGFNYSKHYRDNNNEDKLVEVFLYIQTFSLNPFDTLSRERKIVEYKINDFKMYDVYIRKNSIKEDFGMSDYYSVEKVKEIKGFRKGTINIILMNSMNIYTVHGSSMTTALSYTVSWAAVIYFLTSILGKAYNTQKMKEEFFKESFQVIDNKNVEGEGIRMVEFDNKDIEGNDDESLKGGKAGEVGIGTSYPRDGKIGGSSGKAMSKKVTDVFFKFKFIKDILFCRYNQREEKLVDYMKENAINHFTDAKRIVGKVDQFEYLKYLNLNPYQNHLLNTSKIHLNMNYTHFDHFNNDEDYIKQFFINNYSDNNSKTVKTMEYFKEKFTNSNFSDIDNFVLKKYHSSI